MTCAIRRPCMGDITICKNVPQNPARRSGPDAAGPPTMEKEHYMEASHNRQHSIPARSDPGHFIERATTTLFEEHNYPTPVCLSPRPALIIIVLSLVALDSFAMDRSS